MAALAKRRRRRKIPALEQALTGTVRDHQRRLVMMQLRHIDFFDEQIEALNSAMAGCVTTLSQEAVAARSPPAPAPAGEPAPIGALPPLMFTHAIDLLETIPGRASTGRGDDRGRDGDGHGTVWHGVTSRGVVWGGAGQ
jgi:hypothetical protein